ncbi:MAG TPA: GTP-binding protein [Tepidisphaeraceae bacterium]|jgi:hydrogenase nickel incorporation protein HypB|nr:GTP-binding protein [Tepidisphaeraceae bacterium]
MNGITNPSRKEPLIISLSGNSGCGKTSLLRAAAARLGDEIAAIIATPAAIQAADRLTPFVESSAIRTLDTSRLAYEQLHALAREMNSRLLLVETVSPLVLPQGAPGSHKHVAVFSVAAGNDKVFEFPDSIAHAALVVLTKTDLLPYVPFDSTAFQASVREINPSVPIITVSILRGSGVEAWESWLRAQLQQESPPSGAARPVGTESFIG